MPPRSYLANLTAQGQLLVLILYAVTAYGFFTLARRATGWLSVGSWLAVLALILAPCLLLLQNARRD